VLSPGAWLPGLAPALGLAVERQVLFWFETVGARSAHDSGPISIWEHEPGRFFYAFPRSEKGVKVAFHGGGAPADPDRLDREVSGAEVAAMRAVVQRHMPFASGPLVDTAVCMYTNTADGHFRIGPHPHHERVLVVSACSGHGFKFAPTVGEVVADLLADGATRHDIGLFRLVAPRVGGGGGPGGPAR
jgi:sarcosine oxidase